MNALAYFVAMVAVLVAVVTGGYLLIGVFSERSPEEAQEPRLDNTVASPPISLRLPAGQAAVVGHDSGARIAVPRGATEEQSRVSITRVDPPPSPLEVRSAFDFSVDGSRLVRPVTVHIPFELKPGQDASSVRALRWDEEGGAWEPVLGLVDDSARTIAVTTDRLRLFSALPVTVQASCAASPDEVEAGQTLRVVSTGTSFTSGTIGVYMAPAVARADDGVVVAGGSSIRTEVTDVGWGDRFELTYETALIEPGEYRVFCRVFWASPGTDENVVNPSATVTVRRDGTDPTAAGPPHGGRGWSPAAGSSAAATERPMAGFRENFFRPLDSDRWVLYGSADHLQAEGAVQLTPAQRNQLGFLLLRQPVRLQGSSIEFSFEIGGGTGADGLGLLLLKSIPDFSRIDPAHHAGGGWGSRYLKGYVVAFDTHPNREGRWSRGGRDFYHRIADPSGNFVALVELGAGGDVFAMDHLATRNLSVDLRNSGPFEAEVAIGVDGNIKVYLSNEGRGMGRTLVVDHTIEDFDPSYAYFGFIGATGASTDWHVIRSVKYKPHRPEW